MVKVYVVRKGGCVDRAVWLRCVFFHAVSYSCFSSAGITLSKAQKKHLTLVRLEAS